MKRAILLVMILLTCTLRLLHAQQIDTSTVCPSPEEREKNTLLDVYPNPSNGNFQIVYASLTGCPPPGWGGLLLVNIIDSNGKIVYTESISDFEGEYRKTISLPKHDEEIIYYVIEIVSGKQKMVKREMLY